MRQPTPSASHATATATGTLHNPVLTGFNPDPSILRVGDDYYMATSTFEWFPGVPIYRSRDLANWSLVGHALTRTSQLDLRGVDGSHGVWAPCLSQDPVTKRFYLVYTNVVGRSGNTFHLDNYVVTADAIDGPWGEPVYLNSSGFDPTNFMQSAGLAAFYDTNTFYYLRVYWSDALDDGHGGKTSGRALGLIAGNLGEQELWPETDIPLPGTDGVHLRASIDHHQLRFAWSSDGQSFTPIGPVLDAARLSDEHGPQTFTGAFYTMGCQDRDRAAITADFDYFAYREDTKVHNA